jgi:hypothetical protein
MASTARPTWLQTTLLGTCRGTCDQNGTARCFLLPSLLQICRSCCVQAGAAFVDVPGGTLTRVGVTPVQSLAVTVSRDAMQDLILLLLPGSGTSRGDLVRTHIGQEHYSY